MNAPDVKYTAHYKYNKHVGSLSVEKFKKMKLLIQMVFLHSLS